MMSSGKSSFRSPVLVLVAGLFGFLLPSALTGAAPEEKSPGLEIPAWLSLGPFDRIPPAFAADPKAGFGPAELLAFEEFDMGDALPKPGLEWRWTDGRKAAWTEAAAGAAGLSLDAGGPHPKTAYLAVYVEAFQFRKARLTVRSPQLFRVFFDGRQVADQAKADPNGQATAEIKLETGVHLILVKTVRDPAAGAEWSVRAFLEYTGEPMEPEPRIAVSPAEKVSLRDILDGPQAAGVSLSPDGTNLALTVTRTRPPGDETESWVELYKVEVGKGGPAARQVRSFRGASAVSGLVWAPRGNRFSYTSRDKNGGTIWLVDADSGETKPLLRDFKNLGPHAWAPDGNSLVFSATEEAPKESDLAKIHRNLEDRQPGQRDRIRLYRLALPDGIREPLTVGEFYTDFGGFSPDGRTVLFTRSIVDMTEPSYFRTELYRLDLSSRKEDLLWKGSWLNDARFSPDGKSVLVLGGPEAFGKAGVNVSPGRIPNNYDVQAYLFDLETRAVRPLTRDFAPSIDRAFWTEDGRVIRFLTTDGSWRRLYEYRLGDGSFRRLESGVDVIGSLDIALRAPVAAMVGSSPAVKPRVFVWDLKTGELRPLAFPGPEAAAPKAASRVETWTFKNKRGVEVDGFVVYPPDFDPSRSYPLIVNYYGGTTPIERSFGGRYPNALYAAHGYVVYVPEPSGSVGYGQEISATHVNDWGEVAAGEIIDGVTAFLAAHSFVDPKRVGCIGASYGGFMTMTLATKTDLFAAAISHAGISAIGSYWGEGYWGYSYSAVATAGSFPWNRRDIYVDRSPLFNADRIRTPLLLLHGAADTNVPPGESIQLYTALKILGREAELITFPGEDHRILTYGKRILFNKTILAWFDRWLKGLPDWWLDLYPGT